MNPNDIAPLLMVLIVSTAVVVVLRGPLGHALARWIDRWGRRTDPEAVARLADVETRLAELETSQLHTAELEERVDFAERLLAQQQRGPAHLGEGGR